MPNPSSSLLVPIHLDALCLRSNKLVVEAMADFSRLPYVDRNLKREINAGTPNISEAIVSQPFQSQTLNLRAGVHLHWALPDALTEGIHDAENSTVQFPPVPNRWLVNRYKKSDSTETLEKSWIVESDYIYPAKSKRNEASTQDVQDLTTYKEYSIGEGADSGSISYFYSYPKVGQDYDEPFRFVGRQIDLEAWVSSSKENYFPEKHPLTAIGYGEPTFAAFYPNCHSVFGFYDSKITEKFTDYEYEVIGWYSDAQHDQQLRNFLSNKVQSVQAENFHEALKQEFKWLMKPEANSPWSNLPANQSPTDFSILCYARLTITSTHNEEPNEPIKIAIGNTTGEALSAYLAHQLKRDLLSNDVLGDPEKSRNAMEKLEDQLEWLYLGDQLSSQTLDIGAKFKEIRHQTGFTSVFGGNSWLVKAESNPNPVVSAGNVLQTADASNAQTQKRIVLPPEIANKLHELNHLQREYDTLQAEVESRRRQLFSDWYKYMMSAYHAQDMVRGDDYPDIDKVRFFVGRSDTEPLQQKLKEVEELKRNLTSSKIALEALLAKHNRSLQTHLRVAADDNEILTNPDWQGSSAEIKTSNLSVGTDQAPSKNSRFIKYLLFGNGNYVSIPHQTSNSLTISAWINLQLDDRAPYALFTVGELKIQLKPYFLLTLQTIQELNDLPETVLKALAGAVSKSNQAYDRAAFSEANDLIHALGLPDFLAFWWKWYCKIQNDQPSKAEVLDLWFISLAYHLISWDEQKSRILNATGRASLIYKSRSREVSNVGAIFADRWHHIAVTHNGVTECQIFIDGKPVSSLANLSTGDVSDIIVGSNTTSIVGFQGRMNHIRMDNRVLSAAEIRRDMSNGTRPIYSLQQIEAPRYWQPTEPVILMTGEGVQASDLHGQDGRLSEDDLLECPVLSTDSISQLKTNRNISGIQALRKTIEDAFNNCSSQEIAIRQSTGSPWNPLILEWEVLLQPMQGKTNVERGSFASDMITSNYNLAPGAVDFAVVDNPNRAPGTLYSNSCILTPYIGEQMLDRIAEYLQRYLIQLKEDFKTEIKTDVLQQELDTLKALENPTSEQNVRKEWLEKCLWVQELENREILTDGDLGELLSNNYLNSSRQRKNFLNLTGNKFNKLTALHNWYLNKPGYQKSVDDPIYVAICAGLKLFDGSGKQICFLSQVLTGFNDELLMHKQTIQLPIEDPLAFSTDEKDVYYQFTQSVKGLVGEEIYTAPEPTNQFNPIRSGAMKLMHLRLIDTFGQVKDFNREGSLTFDQEIITPQRLTIDSEPAWIWMPPRLAQPAQMHFRWLSAEENSSNSTPICGWVLPNNLQKSLAVYDQQGKALGSIIQRQDKIQWEPTPGRNRYVDEIENQHLRKVVQHILNKPKSQTNNSETPTNYLDDFLTAIESALESIAPENFAQHQSLALMMGRPLAVVRAELDLHLRGLAAVHQGWYAFESDMYRVIGLGEEPGKRETNNFTKVQFPIQIGQQDQLNDGLVGYWRESSGTLENQFYVSQGKASEDISVDHPDIMTRVEAIQQSIDDPALTLTMLLDPLGGVHATSGILPAKEIRLPVEDYAEALDNIEVTFLTAPILTPQGTRSLALPQEVGFDWNWLEHNQWIDKTVFTDAISTFEQFSQLEPNALQQQANALWDTLKNANWISYQPGETKARTIPMGRRKNGNHGSEDLLISGFNSQQIDELEDKIENLFWSRYSSVSFIDKKVFIIQLKRHFLDIDLNRFWQQDSLHMTLDQIAYMNQLPHPDGKLLNQYVAKLDKGQLDKITQLTIQNCEKIWNLLLDEQVCWLQPIQGSMRAKVISKSDRKLEVLNQSSVISNVKYYELSNIWFPELQQKVEQILDTEALEISSVDAKASFLNSQEIREGWLVLKQQKDKL